MADDDEERQEIPLNEENIEAILNWAVHASSVLCLMLHQVQPENAEEAAELYAGYQQAVEAIYSQVPDVLVEPSHILAHNLMAQHEHTENEVARMLANLDDELKNL